jgi:hypothetical protein
MYTKGQLGAFSKKRSASPNNVVQIKHGSFKQRTPLSKYKIIIYLDGSSASQCVREVNKHFSMSTRYNYFRHA